MKFVIKSLSGWRWMSPPVWGRGLKLNIAEISTEKKRSPPVWGRGLK